MKKNQVIFALVALVAVGFFLRAYHFSDWLHFELDQARDAIVIDSALEGGPGELPLLGPKAGGTYLRLAPGFYYLEYLSALVFGGSPAGMAAFVLIFSVLSIPIFFLLARRFFGDSWSLGLTAIFAVSEFFVMYGRFAWNPNLIPFFVLLGLYALLRATETGERHPGRWFLAAVAALAFATHFHFLVFLAAPTALVLYLLVKRPRYRGRTWVAAVGIVFALYFPMVLNEIETGGQNLEEFWGAITEKSNREDHPLLEKAIRNVSEHALHAIVVTTGFEGADFPSFVIEGRLKWNCPEKCDDGKWYGTLGVIALFLSLVAFVWLLCRETDRKKRDFLILSGIWVGVTFTLFLPLSYGTAPRFFLLSGPFFIILIGLFFAALSRISGGRFSRWAGIVFGVTIAALILANLVSLATRLGEMSRAGTEAVENVPDRILKEKIRVTFEQQERMVDFLEQRSLETGYPIYMFNEPQYRRALKYLITKRGLDNAVLGFDGIYRQGVYYLIVRAQSNLETGLAKYRKSYTVGETTSFGTLLAIELFPLPEVIEGERQDFTKLKPSVSTAPPRYTWNEFFERNSDPLLDEEDADESAE